MLRMLAVALLVPTALIGVALVGLHTEKHPDHKTIA
jgi:hypothetical protein